MADFILNPVTDTEMTALAAAARLAARNAYAPYSHFFVGAALLLESGETIAGCNVENASFRLTNCAEQTAIAAAVAQLGPKIRIRAAAIQNLADASCSPCGACRQTLAEFAPPEAPILFPAGDGENSTRTLAELLPATFILDKGQA